MTAIYNLSCFINVLICIGLGSTYVGSLYIWNNSLGRDHPSTIKKRFISVFFMTVLAAVVLYLSIDATYFKDYSYWSIIGVRSEGLLQACFYPLLLTMLLFSGPLCLYFTDGFHIKNVQQWKYKNNLTWLRNHVVAPFSEEFTFQACMLPILVPCFGRKSISICSLFFGVAHLHHLRERLTRGMTLKVAVCESLFQFLYTTAFGAYSSFLFLKTGHFAAPLVAHSFCNGMGFPDFGKLMDMEQPKKAFFITVFISGLIAWILLLNTLTNPEIFSNKLYL